MAGVAGALAQGIESGFGMARNLALDDERRTQTALENTRKDEADRRAAADLALRGAREARTAEQGELTNSLNALTSTSNLISKRKAEIEGLAAAAQATGRLLPPELSSEYDQHTRTLADIRQKATNLTTRLAGGQVSLDQVPPGDLYTAFAVTTGHKPEDFPKVRAAAADFQSAVEAGNQGLVIQSLNTLMAPQLRRGLGQPSPHGGTIVSKELVNLVPAVDANGQPHPDKVFPVLRVTTDLTGPDGKPLTYIAPMSTGGGTTDAPMALDISKGFQFLGNLGVALTAADNPAVASKLAAGAQVAGAGVDEFFKGELGLAGAARNTAKPGVDQARVDLVHRYMRENGLDPKSDADVKKAVAALHQMGAAVGPGVGAATVRAKLDEISRREDAGELTPEQAAAERSAVVTGVKAETPLQKAQRVVLEKKADGTLPAPKKATGTGMSGGGASTPTPKGADGQPLTGDAYLATLSPDDAIKVKALATGKMKATDISTKGDRRDKFVSMALKYKPDADLGKQGEIGSRESVFIQRVIMSGNQAAHDLENVISLPMTASSGLFGGRKQGAGILDATKEVLANKLTSQEVQSYNVMSTGFQRALASIEAAGLMPTGQLTHQMDAVIFKEGDTNFTKLQKLAQTRQIVEAGLETTVSNPRIPKETREHAQSIIDSIRKSVPFTQQDLLRLDTLQQTNPNVTLKDVKALSKKQGAAPAAVPAKAGPPPGFTVLN